MNKKQTNTFALIGAVCFVLGCFSYIFVSYIYAYVLFGIAIPTFIIGVIKEVEG